MNVFQGDIYYTDLGSGIGCEQSGIRPVVVLQNNVGNKFSPTVIVATMTTNTRDFPTHITIGPECGLKFNSVIQLEQLRTLDKKRLGRKIGHVPPKIMGEVMQRLDISFGRVTKTDTDENTKEEGKETEVVEKLTVIENGLIPVYQSEKGNSAVSARELYKGLELASGQFSRWASVNITENSFFSENIDFYRVRLNVEGNEVDDFIMKIDMAKHLVMLARTEKAHLFRDYFIKIEEKYHQQIDLSYLSPELQMVQHLLNAAAKLEAKVEKLESFASEAKSGLQQAKEVISNIKDTMAELPKDQWRNWVNGSLGEIGKRNSYNHYEYEELRSNSYKLLEERAGADLATRLRNGKKRLEDSGATKTIIFNYCKLDVIEEDKRLKEIYTGIVKELRIKHLV